MKYIRCQAVIEVKLARIFCTIVIVFRAETQLGA